jgi:hypothetical protein
VLCVGAERADWVADAGAQQCVIYVAESLCMFFFVEIICCFLLSWVFELWLFCEISFCDVFPDNDFGPKGAECIALALRDLTGLQTLELSCT